MTPFADLFGARRPDAGGPELPARLRVDGFGTLAAAVLATSDGAHALRIAADPPVPIRFLHRRTARLQRPQPDPPHEGVVVAVTDLRGGVLPDRLDFLIDGLQEQRREFVRVPAAVPVTLSGAYEAVRADGRTIDLSGGGALVKIEGGVVVDRVHLNLDLPEQDPVRAAGAVVRITERGLHAVRLDTVDPRDRERIVAFVTARQRELLRRSRGENPYR